MTIVISDDSFDAVISNDFSICQYLVLFLITPLSFGDCCDFG